MADQHSPQEREIERFEVTGNRENGQPEMVRCPNPLGGGWVRFEDHRAALQDREAEHGKERNHHLALYWFERDRANRAEAALSSARARLTSVIAEEHEIQAALERRDQAWMATRLSYCTGGLVNLRAALDTSIEDREPEAERFWPPEKDPPEACPGCGVTRRKGEESFERVPCPGCKPPAPCSDPKEQLGVPAESGGAG